MAENQENAFYVVCLFVLTNFSNEKGSSAFSCRNTRNNQLPFRGVSINPKQQHRMRQGRIDGLRRRRRQGIPVTALTNNDSKEQRTFLSNWNKLWGKDPRNPSVCGVLLSSFLSLLGFTMVAGPLTPALGRHFQLKVGGLFGALTSAYPLGMMIGIFIWPSLSDRVGRRNILSFSLLFTGLGLMAQAMVILYGGTLFQFLLARSLTGLFAGSSPVSKAYLADIGAMDGKLPRYLSLKDASSTLAFILGPAAGGLLFDVRRRMIGASEVLSKADVLATSGSLAFVIAISAAASMLASLLAGLLVQDSSAFKSKIKAIGAPANQDKENKTKISNHSANFS